MPKTIYNPNARQEIIDRLNRLRPDSPRTFGKLTPDAMMCHMEDAVRVSTGEVPAGPRKTFLSNPIVRRFAIYWMPWPKGKVKTIPEMLATKPVDFNRDRERLIELVRQAGARGPNASWAVHPAFGDISGKDYGVLLYRHFDHHLRQFGV